MIQLSSLIQQNTTESQEKTLIKRFKHYTEQQGLCRTETHNHIKWILRFTRFHNHQHPSDLNESDIQSYLSTLSIENLSSPSIQASAFRSLQFLYQSFLKRPLSKICYLKIAKRRSIGDKFTHYQCHSVLNNMKGTSQLMAKLAFEAQLKISQVVNLRLSDVNIKNNRILIRDAQQQVKFSIKIPMNLMLDLRIQLMRVKQLEQIKRNQFSIEPLTHNPGIFSKNQAVVQQEFLFPMANIDNPDISSQAMQLALLKNDIKIAIKQFLRFTNNNSSNIRSNHLNRLSPNNPSKITPLKKQPQTAFDFSDPLVGRISHLHALKRGAA